MFQLVFASAFLACLGPPGAPIPGDAYTDDSAAGNEDDSSAGESGEPGLANGDDSSAGEDGDSAPANGDDSSAGEDGDSGPADGDDSTAGEDGDSPPADEEESGNGDPVELSTPFESFGKVTVPFDLDIEGTGSNIDSVAFWESPDPEDTTLFVSSRADRLLQVWPFPFSTETETFSPDVDSRRSEINGVMVDQLEDRLYATESDATNRVHVYSLPSLSPIGVFGEGVLGEGETNLGMLDRSNGERWVLVTDDHVVRAYNSDTYSLELELTPDVENIEEVLGDAYHQVIYVPDEMGGDSSHGEGILAFHTDGTPYTKDGSNEFGTDVFESDEEGILLYTCPHDGEEDDGRGFIVVADQRSSTTDFEVFDRLTWDHLGRFRVEEVSGTDGIGSTQIALPGYPLGLFAAVDADSSVKLVSWETIIGATGLECNP